jgi:RND superfamily putative drug exporter
MQLAGDWNWWSPQPLRRLHERLGIRETPAPDSEPELQPAPAVLERDLVRQ